MNHLSKRQIINQLKQIRKENLPFITQFQLSLEKKLLELPAKKPLNTVKYFETLKKLQNLNQNEPHKS